MNVTVPKQGKVLHCYGADVQSMIHMEECGELIQAISKMRRIRNAGKDDTVAYRNLTEEMADVLICLVQMQELYGIPDAEIQKRINRKCKRQEERMYQYQCD